MASVFVTGGTGYLGRALIPALLERGHAVRVLARPSSAAKLPNRCTPVIGDPLVRETFAGHIEPADTFIQLVGTPHPAPWKGEQFRAVDRVSALASIAAAKEAGIRHFVYVSVAQPAPIMRDYLAVRAECEAALRASGMPATILRPWYILGPGHWWPSALIPFYRVMERITSTAVGARRLGLVTLRQMVAALVQAVEQPVDKGVQVLDVPKILKHE